MKRIISLILTLLMLLSVVPTAFAADFSDFGSSHWAYEYVNVLVNDGTINGYADGTFRPEGTVTRAEFVKMIGNGPETRAETFDDVAPSHWAYSYIISSGLEALTDNMFMPDTPITRGDVAVLLWKRAGSPKGVTAPPIVHRQNENYDAVSWVYTNGIMVGNDYIDLRLNDTLTRGEASALIVRSRNVNAQTEKTMFAQKVNPGIYEAVYNAFFLVDRPYVENATITNGELAMAAARLQSGLDFPTYPNLSAEVKFEHKYAQPINMLSRYYLGEECDNAAYADKNATVKEAIAAIMFAARNSASVYILSGTQNYPGITEALNEKYNSMLKTAYANGIWFTTPEDLNLEKEVTMKELACIVLQCNGFSGFHKGVLITPETTKAINLKIRADFNSYPQNASDYRLVLESVSNSVYEKPCINAVSMPKNSYRATNEFSQIFVSMLESWVRALSNAGYKLEATYYPGITVNTGNGYTLRTKLEFTNIPANTKLGDIVNCISEEDGNFSLNSGDVIYADIDTGKPVTDVYFPIDDMILSQLIK
ncbi:MAG: S-layer homology domain-containing protein [Clostridia bacterium]|nr:S-layer homology domain-containing protein [Clostridia bacterium]